MECDGDFLVNSATEPPMGDLSWDLVSVAAGRAFPSFPSCCRRSSRMEYRELALSKELPACVFSSCELCVETGEERERGVS